MCFAANAGYAEFKGLRRPSKSWMSKYSWYCELHKPKPINTSPTESGAQSENGDNQLGIIIGKRVTRSSVLYEVYDITYFVLVTVYNTFQNSFELSQELSFKTTICIIVGAF